MSRAARYTVAFFAPTDDDTELFAVYTNDGEGAHRLADVLDAEGQSVPTRELCELMGAESEPDALAAANDLARHGARIECSQLPAVYS